MSQQVIQSIELRRLVPTPDNPRHLRTDDAAFAELTASIRANGVIVPLLARPLAASAGGDGLLDLRCGHRRLAAAKAAGLTHVPCLVRAMSDAEAMEATVAENLLRDDLRPLEEAQAIANLRRVGLSAEQIAERMGRTPGWVTRRAHLLELSAAWRKAIDDRHSFASAWPAALLERVARLPAAIQDQALTALHHRYPRESHRWTAAELSTWLANEYLHSLAGAAWDVDDGTLHPKAGARPVVIADGPLAGRVRWLEKPKLLQQKRPGREPPKDPMAREKERLAKLHERRVAQALEFLRADLVCDETVLRIARNGARVTALLLMFGLDPFDALRRDPRLTAAEFKKLLDMPSDDRMRAVCRGVLASVAPTLQLIDWNAAARWLITDVLEGDPQTYLTRAAEAIPDPQARPPASPAASKGRSKRPKKAKS